MKAFIRKIVDVRQGEVERTWIMFSYIFLILASHLILKSMTRSLFLKNLGSDQLPFVYLLMASVGGVLAVFQARLAARVRLDRLIYGTTLFLMGNLLIFRGLYSLDVTAAWFYYGLYIWASFFGILTTSQFWLLANYLFDPREAKRLFPLLAAGAILGGISGGYLTHALVKQIGGTPNLTFFCIILLGATLLLINLAWRRKGEWASGGRRKQEDGRVGEVFTLIRNSRHLGFLLGIAALTELVSQIADFQFSTYVGEKIAETDDLTKFLGFWLSNLSVISLLFQVLCAGVIIRRFGVGASLLFLPLTLLMASVWVFLSYGLIPILALKMGDGAFRYSIHKAGLELLLLPIPSEIKKKTKTFMDMFANFLAQGVSGGLLLIFYTWLRLSVAQISLVSVGLIGIWLALALMARREYVSSLRQALIKRSIDAETLATAIEDEATVKVLMVTLASPNERQVVYALQLLESVQGVDLSSSLRPLLGHPSAEVRLRALRLLRRPGEDGLLPEVKSLLHDLDEKVRREAVRYLTRFSPRPAPELLGQWLQEEDEGLRGAALYCVAEQPAMAASLLSPGLIRSFLKQGPEVRRQVADALGILGETAYRSILLELLEDPDPRVRKQAIISAGRTRSPELIPALLRHLGDRLHRRTTREALAAYGDAMIGPLADYLNDIDVPISLRHSFPRVLGLIHSQRAVNVLLDSLRQPDKILRYQSIKALNKLHVHSPELRLDRRVDEALAYEIRKYYQLLSVLYAIEKGEETGTGGSEERRDGGNASPLSPFRSPPLLLQRTLRERLDDHLELIFRLLGLRYPPRDIYNAYVATISPHRAIRANAVEFLDNILPHHLKRMLLPMVEELPTEQVLQSANGFLDVHPGDRKEALRRLASDNDPWLRACTLYEIGTRGLSELRPLVELAREDKDPLVQETAVAVLKRYF